MDPEAYVDVNVFAYWFGNHPTFGRISYVWIKKIEEASRGKYVISALKLYQIMVTIAGLTGKSLKDQELIKMVIDLIESLSGLRIISLTWEDAIQAAKLIEEYGLEYEYAIHLATALRSKAKEIISNDEDFDRTLLKRGSEKS